MIYRKEGKKQGRLATFRTREGLFDEVFDADRSKKFPAGKKIQGWLPTIKAQKRQEEINHELHEFTRMLSVEPIRVIREIRGF